MSSTVSRPETRTPFASPLPYYSPAQVSARREVLSQAAEREAWAAETRRRDLARRQARDVAAALGLLVLAILAVAVDLYGVIAWGPMR